MDACKILKNDFCKSLLPKRVENSNKGTFGKVLNIAGSKSYCGASLLSSLSALRVGCGYVTLASSSYVVDKTASKTSDIVFNELCDGDFIFGSLPDVKAYNAISVGCGLGQNELTQKFLADFIFANKNNSLPFVFDADALNIIAKLEITELPPNSILTPHPAEMARLLSVSLDDVLNNRNYSIQEAVKKYNANFVLKGHNTLIATDNNMYQDVLGTSILAKAGTGDVLTGIITGLLAQGLNCSDAMCLGVFIHSQAGLCASSSYPDGTLFASELIDFIPNAIKVIVG